MVTYQIWKLNVAWIIIIIIIIIIWQPFSCESREGISTSLIRRAEPLFLSIPVCLMRGMCDTFLWVNIKFIKTSNLNTTKYYQIIKRLNQIISENNPYNLRICTFTFHKFQEKNLEVRVLIPVQVQICLLKFMKLSKYYLIADLAVQLTLAIKQKTFMKRENMFSRILPVHEMADNLFCFSSWRNFHLSQINTACF